MVRGLVFVIFAVCSFPLMFQGQRGVVHSTKFIESENDTLELVRLNKREFYIRNVCQSDSVIKEFQFHFRSKKLVGIVCVQNGRTFKWLDFEVGDKIPGISTYYNENIQSGIKNDFDVYSDNLPCENVTISTLWKKGDFVMRMNRCNRQILDIYEFVQMKDDGYINHRNGISIAFRKNKVKSINNYALDFPIGLWIALNKRQKIKFLQWYTPDRKLLRFRTY